jgi:hypothetical protein
MTAPQLDSLVGDGSDASAHDSAARLAALMAAGMPGRTPPPAPDLGAVLETPPSLETPPALAPVAAAVAPPAEAPPVLDGFTDEQFGEAEKVLTDLGVDLGVDRSAVPAELLPAYGRLVQSAIDLSQAELNERLSAHDAQRQVQEFGERMEKEPEKLLLAIAITKPDVMEKVIQVFQQMQGDESYKDLVIREMQTDARDRDIGRREALLRDQDILTKSRQVTTATRVACRKLGVPFEMGEKVVALAIKANQGKFEAHEAEGIIAGIRGLVQTPAARPPVAAPGKVTAQGAAPGAPVASTAAPSGTPPAAPVQAREGGGSVFRALIREANARVIAAVQNR